MSIENGSQFPYREFRGRHSGERSAPQIWRWETVSRDLGSAEHTEYGTLTLSRADGAHEVVPGTAMTFQVVRPGGRTTSHCHSWWHLYFVRSGHGRVVFEESDDRADLHPGDIMVIPAWNVHRFENPDDPEDMILLSMTNLPQQAGLGNLLSRETADATI